MVFPHPRIPRSRIFMLYFTPFAISRLIRGESDHTDEEEEEAEAAVEVIF